MKEANIMRIIELALGKLPNLKIFRNNVGMGWIGESKRITTPTTLTLPPGTVIIKNARPLHAGLCEGSSDLIGWTTVTITPEMVGKKVAIFSALEIKRDAHANVSPKQRNFLEVVKQNGGIAGIAHSPDGARDIIDFHTK
jgi:hypothetical protein